MIGNGTSPLIQHATHVARDRAGAIPRRMIAALFRRLDASPLPDAERLVEAELLELLRPTIAMPARPFVSSCTRTPDVSTTRAFRIR